MTSRHRATLRGQGLIANDVGAIAHRWLNYARVVLLAVIAGALLGGWIMSEQAPGQFRAAVMYGEAKVKVGSGPSPAKPRTVLSAPSEWRGLAWR